MWTGEKERKVRRELLLFAKNTKEPVVWKYFWITWKKLEWCDGVIVVECKGDDPYLYNLERKRERLINNQPYSDFNRSRCFRISPRYSASLTRNPNQWCVLNQLVNLNRIADQAAITPWYLFRDWTPPSVYFYSALIYVIWSFELIVRNW